MPQPIKFRNLKRHLADHFQSAFHNETISRMTNQRESNKTLTSIGLSVSMAAYSIIFHGEPFRAFENRMTEHVAARIQVGNINHSSHFLRRFLNTAFAYLQQNVQTFLATNLECTGNLPVICIKPDKFTKKGQSNQAVIIRHPALKHGKLFRETYLGHLPCGESSTGHAVTELRMRSLYETVSLYDT